jgi:hypothetical protein
MLDTLCELTSSDIFNDPEFEIRANSNKVIFPVKGFEYSFGIDLRSGIKTWRNNNYGTMVPFSRVFDELPKSLKEKMVFHLVTLRESPGTYFSPNTTIAGGISNSIKGNNVLPFHAIHAVNRVRKPPSHPSRGYTHAPSIIKSLIKAKIKKNKSLPPEEQKKLDAQCKKYLHGVRTITSCHNPSCPGIH